MHMNFILKSLAEARRALPKGNSNWYEEGSLLLACLLCELVSLTPSSSTCTSLVSYFNIRE
jgi:hypothetical protein